MPGYEKTLELAKRDRYYKLPGGLGKGDWLEVLKECYKTSREYGEFAGSWIADKTGWFPGLRTLRRYGLVEKTLSSRRGQRAYYIMPDPDGVRKALRKLNILKNYFIIHQFRFSSFAAFIVVPDSWKGSKTTSPS